MANKQTTGATISRLGVLTVLAHNQVPGNEVGPLDKARMLSQIEEILDGKAGVSKRKVQVRTLQRCAIGGALVTSGDVGLYGSN